MTTYEHDEAERAKTRKMLVEFLEEHYGFNEFDDLLDALYTDMLDESGKNKIGALICSIWSLRDDLLPWAKTP
jgi:hypothetical protein